MVNLGRQLAKITPYLAVEEYQRQPLNLELQEPNHQLDRVSSVATLDLQQELEVYFLHQILQL